MLSPAAYLVELLEFVDVADQPHTLDNPLDVLLAKQGLEPPDGLRGPLGVLGDVCERLVNFIRPFSLGVTKAARVPSIVG